MDIRTSESYKNVYNPNTTNQSEIHNTKEFQDTSVPKYKFASKQSHQKFETCKNYDRGDSELNTTTTTAGPPKSSLVHRYPEHPNAGEYLNRVNHTNSTHQYESNQESQAAQQETMGTKTLQYTPAMIKDQELLVSAMSQQGIPEVLIRRQFNRLLEEQAKQIQFDAPRSVDNKSVNDCEKKRPQQHNVNRMDNCVPMERKGHCNCIPAEQTKSNPQFRTNTYQDQQQQQHQHQQQQEQYQQEEQHQHQQSSDSSISNARLQKVEPVSLLKLRMKREALDSERRNNGLQEAAVAYEILKRCKPVENKSESSSEKREEMRYVKLNGTQDRKDMEALCMHQNLQERFGTQQKRTSSNGLENSRDPNNPRPSIRSQCVKCPTDTQYFTGYPRQKNQMYYSQQQNNNYERDTRHETRCQMMNNDTSDNSRVVQEQPQPPQQQSTNDTRTRDETQPQRMCYNNMTFWPEIQEPKIIGGLTYLARKPHCIPKIPGFMCEQLQSQ